MASGPEALVLSGQTVSICMHSCGVVWSDGKGRCICIYMLPRQKAYAAHIVVNLVTVAGGPAALCAMLGALLCCYRCPAYHSRKLDEPGQIRYSVNSDMQIIPAVQHSMTFPMQPTRQRLCMPSAAPSSPLVMSKSECAAVPAE